MTITDFIINDISPLDISSTVGDVQTVFSETTYSHVPIMRDGKYIGSLPESDAHCYDAITGLEDCIHNFNPFFVRYETNWLDVLEAFAKHDTNVMPVLDDTGVYLGYYELSDVMQVFNHTPFMSEPGNILVIEHGIHDYSFSEISQIVESNDGRILGMLVSQVERDVAQISLKIGSVNFNEILAAFRRYSYTIVSSHQEDTFLKELQDRSKYLDRYLNI